MIDNSQQEYVSRGTLFPRQLQNGKGAFSRRRFRCSSLTKDSLPELFPDGDFAHDMGRREGFPTAATAAIRYARQRKERKDSEISVLVRCTPFGVPCVQCYDAVPESGEHTAANTVDEEGRSIGYIVKPLSGDRDRPGRSPPLTYIHTHPLPC